MIRYIHICIGLWLVGFAPVASYQLGKAPEEVVHLDDTTFDSAINDSANPLWFLKFYAPWCGHCKHMAPTLDKVAPELTGKMAIGKIDCTVHKSLCGRFGVRGYPTLKYSLDGEIFDYPGARDEFSIKDFAKRMNGPAVTTVTTYMEALDVAAKQSIDQVAFLGYDPRSTPESPSPVRQVFDQVARKFQASAVFVWLLPGTDERNYEFIHKIEPNVQPKSFESKDNDITTITAEDFVAWVLDHNYPLISEFGSRNFQKMGRNGRRLAINVVDFSDQAQKTAVTEHLTQYAKSINSEEANKYYFGVMDGKRWAKALQQFSVKEDENPQTIVLDVPAHEYWQNSTYKNTFDFMKAVEAGEIESRDAKMSLRPGFFGRLEIVFLKTFPYSLILLLVIVFGIVFCLVPGGDDLRPPYDRVHEEEGEVIGDVDDDVDADDKADEEPKKEK